MLRSNVGDKYVLEEMQKTGATLGGEQSGHILFMDATTGDGLLTALRVLEVVARSGKSLHELIADFKVFPQVIRNVKVREKTPMHQLPTVAAAIHAAECARRQRPRRRPLLRHRKTRPRHDRSRKRRNHATAYGLHRHGDSGGHRHLAPPQGTRSEPSFLDPGRDFRFNVEGTPAHDETTIQVIGAPFQRRAFVTPVQIAADIESREFFNSQQAILRHVNQLVKDELWRQWIVKDNDIVKGDRRHRREVGQASKAKHFELDVKRRIVDPLPAGLQNT